MPSVTQFLGNTVGEAAAFAAGLAVGPALHPVVQAIANESWQAYPDKPIDAGTLAVGVAEGHITLDQGTSEAALTGVSAARFAELVAMARSGPGATSAFALWRRGLISDGQFDGALTRAGVEPDWIALLRGLKDERLDPAVIAVTIQRGIIKDPGFLPVSPPTTGGKVPAFPVSGLDALAEAEASGVDRDRLFALTAIVGNPASPDLAARMTYRGIIDRTDFDRAIAEGNTRNEWGAFLFDGFRQILTAHDWVELHLRGWVTQAEMYAGTALHGMSQADTDQLFRVLGRPVPVHQVVTGEARGGTYNGDYSAIPLPFLKTLQESNIRPEWYALAYANRYSYPSAFVLRAITQAGDITPDEAHQALLDIGWPPELAATVSAAWSTGKAAAVKSETAAQLREEYEGLYISQAELLAGLETLGYDAAEARALAHLADAARVKKYRDAVVTATYKAFTGHEIDEQTARSDLAAVNISTEAADHLIPLWTTEMNVQRKQLTAAQIKRAYVKALITQAVALVDLEDRGYSAADAQTYLGS